MARKSSKPKKLTIKEQYNKTYEKLTKDIVKYQNLGYQIPDTILPKKPKNIRRQNLNKLNELKVQQIAKQYDIVDMSTGEAYEPQGRKVKFAKEIEKINKEYAKNQLDLEQAVRQNTKDWEERILEKGRRTQEIRDRINQKVYVDRSESQLAKRFGAEAVIEHMETHIAWNELTEADVVRISNLYSRLESLPSQLGGRVIQELNQVMAKEGTAVVAKAIKESEDEGVDFWELIQVYDSETAIAQYMSSIVSAMPFDEETKADLFSEFDTEDYYESGLDE